MLLAINAGSSSVKYATFDAATVARLASGTLPRATDANAMLGVLQSRVDLSQVTAVGHRIVLSMRRPASEAVTPELLDLLARAAALEPDHLPAQLALIAAIGTHAPSLRQIICNDSAFHETMPRVAQQLPIPRRFEADGIRRYGFHGLSCAFLVEELGRQAGESTARGRVILAHLGGGASITAVRDGKSVDTSMGFTPAGGLMMGTRPGDLDPGLMVALMQREQLSPEAFNRLANEECGLLGVSTTTGNMAELIALQAHDMRAAEAIELFCYQTSKWIATMAAALGGVDTVVFAGGIGEHVAPVRERICRDLRFLGVDLDPVRNAAGAPVVSRDTSPATVRVMATDEEVMIARAVWQQVRLGA